MIDGALLQQERLFALQLIENFKVQKRFKDNKIVGFIIVFEPILISKNMTPEVEKLYYNAKNKVFQEFNELIKNEKNFETINIDELRKQLKEIIENYYRKKRAELRNSVA